MKKILQFMIGFFLVSIAIMSFTYADSKSDIETIYSDKISSIETQMNRAYSDLEAIYATSITNAQARLKDANDNIKRIQDIYSFQLDLAINAFKSSGVVLSESELRSMAEDSIRGVKTQVDAQIDAQEKNLIQITAQIKSIQDEKASKLAQSKNQYQVKIDALITERDDLIKKIKETEVIKQIKETEVIKQAIESTNKTEQQGNQTCQSKLGANATINSQGTCVCKIGYELSNSNVCLTKTEQQSNQDGMYSRLLPSCQSGLGSNATIDSKGTCVCKIGHELGSSNICITKAERQKEQEILNNSVSKEIKKEYNSQTTVSPNYSYQKTVKDFKKSKILSIDTTLENGTQVTLYKVIKTATNGTRDVYIAKIKVGKNGKVTYRLKNHGIYKIIQ